MTDDSVRPGRSRATAVDVLVEGFLDDPFFVWTTPDADARLTLLDAVFALAVSAAAQRRMLTCDERGVLVLVPPGQRLYDDAEAARARGILRDAFAHPPGLLADYDRRVHHAAPRLQDAWYLQYLAVPASLRGHGRGRALMGEALARAGGGPMWLHTGRPSTLGFYARFGFGVHAEVPCTPAGPTVYILTRPGSGVGAASRGAGTPRS